SENEHFGPAGVLAAELTQMNNETCNVYNMLKLTRNLFEVTGDVKYAHFYEKGYLNAIMGSQNPETGMSMYFQPMKTGFFKVFSTPEHSFWCCTGTGMENFTKLNDSIYFHDQDAIYVNLYLASTLEWPEKQIKLIQTTNLPVSDTVKFTIKRLQEAAKSPVGLKLRVPDWVKGEASVKINGKSATVLPVQGYLEIVRQWADNDTVELTLPLEVGVSRLPDDPDMVAFTFGPLVLCAPLGTKNMEQLPTGINGTVKIPDGDTNINDTLLIKGKPADWLKNLKANLVRTSAAKLEFKLTNARPELVFVPYYSHYKERYGIHWKLTTEKGQL
ncbi:MAG TPA: beta-L-arabinofuranosidase domain-containing protein, partial [Bacillota bacterium]|nr:beta-L-arabinofuranosidase domain-containing protein [Bacillota bacterium]